MESGSTRLQAKPQRGPLSLSCPWGQSQQNQPCGAGTCSGQLSQEPLPTSTLSSSSLPSPSDSAGLAGSQAVCTPAWSPGTQALGCRQLTAMRVWAGPERPRSMEQDKGSAKRHRVVSSSEEKGAAQTPQPTAATQGTEEGCKEGPCQGRRLPRRRPVWEVRRGHSYATHSRAAAAPAPCGRHPAERQGIAQPWPTCLWSTDWGPGHRPGSPAAGRPPCRAARPMPY